MRKYGDVSDIAEGDETSICDIVKITLNETCLDKVREEDSVFKRTLETVPEIDSDCFIMTYIILKVFMSVISHSSANVEHPLCKGYYIINDNAKAWLDGNKLFQLHSIIAGSTG